MAQTKQASVLTLVHDRRLNEPMVRDKSIMHRLNGLLGGERANRLNPDSAQLGRILHYTLMRASLNGQDDGI